MSEDSLPLEQWPAGIQQASVPANENALRVQALLSRALSVENDAPGTEYNGAVYIVGDTPAGAFASFAEHDIALYEYDSWYAWSPVLGTSMVVNDVRKVFDGTEWVDDPAGGGGSGVVETIVAGTGITVNDADPANPVVSATGGGGGSDLGWFNVIDYGATLDGVHLTDVATTASDNTVASASAAFDAGDVGKVIEIVSGSNRAKTTIASINSGTSIEVTDAPSFTASDCDTYYGTDDTAAWQGAIDAAESAGGGVVYAPAGISIIDGALQDTSRGNAQILFPEVDKTTEKPITIEIRGECPPPSVPSVVGGMPVPEGGTIIKSTINGGPGNVIGGWGPVGAFADLSRMLAIVRNLIVRLPPNPQLTAIDLSHMALCEVDNVGIDAGSYYVGNLAQPSTSTSYALRCPINNNAAYSRLGYVVAVGFYNGFQFAEHVTGENVCAHGCRVGFEFASGANHASCLNRLLAQHCTTPVLFTGQHYCQIQQLDIERAASGWQQTTYDISDASNYGRGTVNWHTVLAGTGPVNTFTMNGGARISTRRIAIGYGIEQVSVSSAITFSGIHANKHILHPSSDTTARTWTIPANSSVPYQVGTTLTFVNQDGAGAVTISITSDTLRLAGAGTTGSRTLAANGVATAIKITSTEWVINGSGLT